jgi:type I restriction enzyme, S subunit
MDLQTFWDNFEIIAEAPGGIAKLRALILDLAVRGKLVRRSCWKKLK